MKKGQAFKKITKIAGALGKGHCIFQTSQEVKIFLTYFL